MDVQLRRAAFYERSGRRTLLGSIVDNPFSELLPEDEPRPKAVRASVSIPLSVYEDLAFVAELFSEFGKRGLLSKKHWNQTQVMVHFARLGLAGLGKSLEAMGGIPRTEESRKAVLARAMDVYARLRPATNKKK